MGINNYRPEELTNQRKLISDAKNTGDDLTVDNKGKRSSHGEAAAGVRKLKDKLDMRKLFSDDDYFEEMFNSL